MKQPSESTGSQLVAKERPSNDGDVIENPTSLGMRLTPANKKAA